MMDTNNEKDVPPQGDGTPRGRRGGSTVPALPVSSSDDGPAAGLMASPAVEMAIAWGEGASFAEAGWIEPIPGMTKDVMLRKGQFVFMLREGDKRAKFDADDRFLTRREKELLRETILSGLLEEREYRIYTLKEMRNYERDDKYHTRDVGVKGCKLVYDEEWDIYTPKSGSRRHSLKNSRKSSLERKGEEELAAKRAMLAASGSLSPRVLLERLRMEVAAAGAELAPRAEPPENMEVDAAGGDGVGYSSISARRIEGGGKKRKTGSDLALPEGGIGPTTAPLERGRPLGELGILREENSLLRAEVGALRRELEKIMEVVKGGREEVQGMLKEPPQQPKEGMGWDCGGLENRLMARIEALVEAKFLALREELASIRPIRPPVPGGVGSGPPAPVSGEGRKRNRGRGGGGGAALAAPAAAAQPPVGVAIPPPLKKGVEWSKVVGRKERREANQTASRSSPNGGEPPKGKSVGGKGRGPVRSRLPRPPRTAAVTLTIPGGGQEEYAAAVREARRSIDLPSGVAALTCKRAVTGALIFEVPGPDAGVRADRLAQDMGKLLGPKGARVGRPSKRVDMRLRGLDDSVTHAEVLASLAEAGGCPEGDVRVGEIRRPSLGTGTVWAQCPVAAARKLAVAGKVRVGWVEASVDILRPRPLQCYRCMAFGHVGQRCTSAVDRSGCCYRCGEPGHRAARCSADRPKCPVCVDGGRPADHRLGGGECPSSGGKSASFAGGVLNPPRPNSGGSGRPPEARP